ncbi:long-chain-fatty-acid--CoA ligase [bacterium BMS3Abin05]|nr:long-chain-fatty-acid--CoA ligase [bacterium BMS3Abin05]GBE26952.1 long-chain-fatty-acid--CoA ligase [bacterium BMS3Bbin03]HDK35596.1 long-chain fatty acid--CoA ligase [Bacteroidota bacterium]HDL78569.1 long-chain fatty acid--CoA ligase [Bacteroidota bacterium]HDZ11202.1 long-chain fatty acid--CoA ligase [Bacteroidota bacterium]
MGQTLSKRTIRDLIYSSFEAFPDQNALAMVGDTPFTYSDIKELVHQISKVLQWKKLKKGDRVAILAENSPLWGAAYFAIVTSGRVVVPILTEFHPTQIHHIIRNSGARLLFTTKKMASKLEDGKLGQLECILSLDDFEFRVDGCDSNTLTKAVVAAETGVKKFEEYPREEDDLACIIYTSGTTGNSKGVMLTHKNIVSNVLSVSQIISVSTEDRLLSILPLSHAYEASMGFLAALYFGATIYYIEGLPTAMTLLPAMQKVKPTIILSVPLIMEKIYKKKVLAEINKKPLTRELYKFSVFRKLLNKLAGKKLLEAFGGGIRFFVFGGAAISPDVENFMREAKIPYTTGYGLTEASPLLAANPLEKVKVSSTGPAVPEVTLKIVDRDPITGIGEIYAKGPNIMPGYFNNPVVSKEVLTDDGWLITGDRGYLDEEGYLFIKGRSKNVIVGSNGENIYPEEIEEILNESSYVMESLVLGRDRKIIAKVYLDYDVLDLEFSKQNLTESEIRTRINNLLQDLKHVVNKRVAGFSKIHEIYEQPEPFQKTPTKKIKRYLYKI